MLREPCSSREEYLSRCGARAYATSAVNTYTSGESATRAYATIMLAQLCATMNFSCDVRSQRARHRVPAIMPASACACWQLHFLNVDTIAREVVSRWRSICYLPQCLKVGPFLIPAPLQAPSVPPLERLTRGGRADFHELWLRHEDCHTMREGGKGIVEACTRHEFELRACREIYNAIEN